ncbi:MAG: macro domain-containing protein, partial [Nitrospirae bacterium]|nr:macro domain-containing protein [Nitrospirota bacterium]
GVALAAAKRFPNLPSLLGAKLRATGNHAYYWHEFRLLTLPTKEAWTQPSTLGLIERTAREAVHLADHHELTEIYCPRLGCGLGGLAWKDVASVLTGLWDGRFIIVHKAS